MDESPLLSDDDNTVRGFMSLNFSFKKPLLMKVPGLFQRHLIGEVTTRPATGWRKEGREENFAATHRLRLSPMSVKNLSSVTHILCPYDGRINATARLAFRGRMISFRPATLYINHPRNLALKQVLNVSKSTT